MCTTINIDDDVLLAAKELARRDGKSAGAVISEPALKALTGGLTADNIETSDGFYGFHPLPSRGRPVTNQLINQLRNEEPE